ncbi:MAG: glycosyltransferase family 4 protein [Nitrobacter sp.]|uniref:glycosyltransferase family 4 protein n=1 Tax=Nitrobacter sp. TaxID=29420 RepID=UPI00262E57C3|nr:glycosyltransferase family 4 protein [Nitrobacter sp.]MCV0386493.1 glycosyltransferase family 4 protein [Nitrobacter sp.]
MVHLLSDNDAMTAFLVTQHFRPDETSTSVFLTAIAEELAKDDDVVVISGTRGSARAGNPAVLEMPSWSPPKTALIRRALAMLWFCMGALIALTWRARRDTPVFVVTTPFMLPYFVSLAAWLRGAPTTLILYDLYPESLIAANLIAKQSWTARLILHLNEWMFHILEAVVVIGRDMEKHLSRYKGATSDKICFIPHWSTLAPALRPVDPDNQFRPAGTDKLVVGLSGNLGFTHDPDTVFAAARALADQPGVHFLLSGWGVGWHRLVDAQRAAGLPNVTLMERVAETDLENFLTAADVWIIPYRRGMSGISSPSRLYNLLAIGRPVIALSESDAEYGLMLSEHRAGWVVEPENAAELAQTICAAAHDPGDVATRSRNAVQLLQDRFTRDSAGNAYCRLANQLRTTGKTRTP